ncbi:hypothetical protein MKW94_016793, partial [Papaver nudicaule]|nr:hypothetical protein [Papaver nudicaule]
MMVMMKILRNMGRRKTEMKRIENVKDRQVTFSKRKNGLMKKAFELSVLCEAEVAVLVFSPKGKLHEFSSNPNSMEKTIERYRMCGEDVQVNHSSNTNNQLEQQNSQLYRNMVGYFISLIATIQDYH